VQNTTDILTIKKYENIEMKKQEEIQKAIEKQCRLPTEQFSSESDTELDAIKINESYYWIHVGRVYVTET